MGSRDLCAKRTKRIFRPRLFKRTDVFCQGKEIVELARTEKGGRWVFRCVKPE